MTSHTIQCAIPYVQIMLILEILMVSQKKSHGRAAPTYAIPNSFDTASPIVCIA